MIGSRNASAPHRTFDNYQVANNSAFSEPLVQSEIVSGAYKILTTVLPYQQIILMYDKVAKSLK